MAQGGLEVLVKFTERFKLLTVDFDGCSLGLKSVKGNPIKKPWRIVTTSQKLVDTLTPYVCVHKNASDHDICQGAETLKSGFYTELLAKKIITGLCPPEISKPTAKSKAPLAIPVTVGSVGVGRTTVAEGRREELGLENSGGSSSKIIQTAIRQLDKVVTRATAKLANLMESTEKLQAYNIESQNLLITDDRTVEKQLLFHQIDQIQKDMKHREKLDLLPINFMGLVIKNPY